MPPIPRPLPRVRIPQLRVLKILAGDENEDTPALTRQKLNERSGFSSVSGTITRVMNGVPQGSSSGAERPGLIPLGCVRKFDVDIDGIVETVYQITPLGREVLAANPLPTKRRSREASINHRYKENQGNGDLHS